MMLQVRFIDLEKHKKILVGSNLGCATFWLKNGEDTEDSINIEFKD